MKHRFPIGTQYMSRGKHPLLCTVVDHLTLTNSKGEIIRVSYITEHLFLGQIVKTHDVVDPTIAMGLTPEFQHLLK